MKSAIVTGGSSGIGLECAKMLIDEGYKVYAVARDFKKSGFDDPFFIKTKCDLTQIKEIKELEKRIDKKDLKILINNAGVGYFAPHEELDFEKINKMIDLNLRSPLLITKLFLRSLKQNSGYIFNINSISALKPSFFGAVYGASKAALRHFGVSLFEEARKSGLKVVNINPDFTKTPFFENLNFSYSDDPLSYIEPSCISEVIQDILSLREGTVITDITIQPQKFKILKKKRLT